jgi:hypothetical protein
MASQILGLLALSPLGAAPDALLPSPSWQRGRHVRLTVEPNFTYSARMPATNLTLTSGSVSLRCGGGYLSLIDGGLRPTSAQMQTSGHDPRLGAYDEVAQRFAGNGATGGLVCDVIASIRYLHAHDAFSFKLKFPSGAQGTLAYPTPQANMADGGGLPLPNQWAKGPLPLASHFPSFVVPPTLSFMQTSGNMLGGNFGVGKMSAFAGGLYGGPLVLFDDESPRAKTAQLPAITLSPLTHHKAVFTSQEAVPVRGAGPYSPQPPPFPGINISDRVSVGVSGYINEVSSNSNRQSLCLSTGYYCVQHLI